MVHGFLPPSEFGPLQSRTLVRRWRRKRQILAFANKSNFQPRINFSTPQKWQKSVTKPVKQCCLSCVLPVWVIRLLLSWAAAALSNDANELSATSLWHYWHTELDNTAPFGKSRCTNVLKSMNLHIWRSTAGITLLPLLIWTSLLACFKRFHLQHFSVSHVVIKDLFFPVQVPTL